MVRHGKSVFSCTYRCSFLYTISVYISVYQYISYAYQLSYQMLIYVIYVLFAWFHIAYITSSSHCDIYHGISWHIRNLWYAWYISQCRHLLIWMRTENNTIYMSDDDECDMRNWYAVIFCDMCVIYSLFVSFETLKMWHDTKRYEVIWRDTKPLSEKCDMVCDTSWTKWYGVWYDSTNERGHAVCAHHSYCRGELSASPSESSRCKKCLTFFGLCAGICPAIFAAIYLTLCSARRSGAGRAAIMRWVTTRICEHMPILRPPLHLHLRLHGFASHGMQDPCGATSTMTSESVIAVRYAQSFTPLGSSPLQHASNLPGDGPLVVH